VVTVYVDERSYQATPIGGRIILEMRRGYLGYPWASSLAVHNG
jgi:hypothetical protein